MTKCLFLTGYGFAPQYLSACRFYPSAALRLLHFTRDNRGRRADVEFCARGSRQDLTKQEIACPCKPPMRSYHEPVTWELANRGRILRYDQNFVARGSFYVRIRVAVLCNLMRSTCAIIFVRARRMMHFERTRLALLSLVRAAF